MGISSLRKGEVVAINAIHLDQMPAFEYDKLQWGERQIRSVANMTRVDARDFLALAHKLNIQPRVSVFSLDQATHLAHGQRTLADSQGSNQRIRYTQAL
jgi:propanol-preferring alcohol dehydrogenase